MTTIDFGSLLESLRDSISEFPYTALPVPEVPGLFFAVDRTGRPAMLLSASHPGAPLTIRTDMVSLFMHSQGTLFIRGAEPSEGRYHMLSCESSDPGIQETFVVLIEAVARNLASHQFQSDQLVGFFHTMVRLFRVTPAPDLTLERQGLWGELFLMSTIGDIRRWVSFWHSDPQMKFDFASGNRRLEAKTTTGAVRRHQFSHQQLFSADKVTAIASLMLQRDDAGLSLRDLIRQTREAVNNDLHLLGRLEAAVRQAGMQDPDEVGPCFDESGARGSLRWFWTDQVPRFDQYEPPGVSNTHYSVDLSTTESIGSHELSAWLAEW